MDTKKALDFETVELDDKNSALVIIDQTLLPNEFTYLHLTTQPGRYLGSNLRITSTRCSGNWYCGCLWCLPRYKRKFRQQILIPFYAEFKKVKEYLASSRPTAVNLFWALDRMDACVQKNKSKSISEIKELLRKESEEIKAEDIWVCKTIGEYGLSLLRPNIGILTHCNAGQLATAKYGTATAPIYLGTEKGYNFKVYADETRPLLQGARLTAFELNKAGVDVTLDL